MILLAVIVTDRERTVKISNRSLNFFFTSSFSKGSVGTLSLCIEWPFFC